MADESSILDNFYDLLAVSPAASDAEIRRAEAALRKIYDHRAHQGDAQAVEYLRRLNEASAELLDPHRRAEHDRRPEIRWHGFVDLAVAAPLARGERRAVLDGWLREAPGGRRDPVREATLLDAASPLHLLRRDAALDE